MAAVETELAGRDGPPPMHDPPSSQPHALASSPVIPYLSSLAGVSPVLSVPSHQQSTPGGFVSCEGASAHADFHFQLPLFGHAFVDSLCRSVQQSPSVPAMPDDSPYGTAAPNSGWTACAGGELQQEDRIGLSSVDGGHFERVVQSSGAVLSNGSTSSVDMAIFAGAPVWTLDWCPLQGGCAYQACGGDVKERLAIIVSLMTVTS